MFEAQPRLVLLVMLAASLAAGYCPPNRIHSTGYCSFRVTCIGNIRGVNLPDECRGSVNHPVNVDLSLYDAIERFDDHIETDFLSAVTRLQVNANWPTTTLSFLKYMPKLHTLILSNNQIKNIEAMPFFALKHLQTIDLSGNYLSDVEELFVFEDQPNNVRRLNLARNAIEELPGDVFSELSNLKELDLSYNNISSLDEEPFSNLTSLEILRLNNNRIKDLNGAVNSLVNLKHLYLRGNQIQHIDEQSLKIIHHLETFDASENQLEQLMPVLFSRHWQHVGSICKIILSGNQITSIPNGTSLELTSRFTRQLGHKVDVLTEVDLSGNAISNIEYNAFQSIVQMTTLDLSSNNLTVFIVNPKNVMDVKFLNLSSNYISNLYFESFSSMKNLQNLDLSHNTLIYIPDETFTNNYNLKVVNITFNYINILKNLRVGMFHKDGGLLDLSNNGLSQLEIPFGEALRLSVLILNSNEINNAVCVNLIYQTELKMLQMRNNKIPSLKENSLLLPNSLNYLDLGENLIEDIGPSTFTRVSHLKTLILRRNRLRDIQYGAFRGLISLTNLDLSFNNILTLDSKVLMDLKSLSVLSLRSNGLYNLDYKGWLGHTSDIKVYLEGNSISCEWLGEALTDYNNGYSKMRPTVSMFRVISPIPSLEGIPCVPNSKKKEKLLDWSKPNVLADERLLVINQKILEAVKEQTYYLRTFMNQVNTKIQRK